MSGRGILMPMRLTDPVARPTSLWADFQIALAAFVLVAGILVGRGGSYRRAARRRRDGNGGRSPGRFRATVGPRAAPSAARPAAATAASSSMCGRRSASATAPRASPMTTRSTASPTSIDQPEIPPREPGRAVRVADMAGRARAYDLAMTDGARHAAVGIALSQRCDLLVAVAQGRARAGAAARWRSTISVRANCITG